MNDTKSDGLFFGVGSPYRDSFELHGKPMSSRQLLDVLDLTRPGLEEARRWHLAGDIDRAQYALLDYFRSRKTVAYPTWAAEQSGITELQASGVAALSATDDDVRVAEQAMQRIFQPYHAYPPTQYASPLNWDWDPHGNIEWSAHMHRMSGWDLSTARCYSALGDERYARLWVELTDDWIAANPLTRERCYFPQSWDAIQVGIRSTRWSGLLPYFLNSPACTPEFLARLLTSLYNHARKTHEMMYPNNDNFFIIESAGLADVALAFPEFIDAAGWRNAAFDRLMQAMNEQVLGDGMHGELSPAYHLYCASLFLNVADTAMRNGHSAPFITGTERMMDVLYGISTPQRCLPVVGDASPSDVRPLLSKAARISQRNDLLALATEGQQGQWTPRRNYAFQQGGFYAFRSDWSSEALWMCLHCGPANIQPSAFHTQFDNGTFELISHGQYLMRDPGVYCYAKGDPRREAFRRTATHQTLTLGDAISIRAGRLLQWVEDDGEGNASVTVENQSYPALAHRRTVFFVARKWFVIVDEALGTTQGRVALHYQFSPGDLRIDERLHTARTYYPHGINVLVWQPAYAPVAVQAEEAWYSPQHNEKMLMPAIRIEHEHTTLPLQFLTVIAPFTADDQPRVSAQFNGEAGSDVLSVALWVDDEYYRLQRNLAK